MSCNDRWPRRHAHALARVTCLLVSSIAILRCGVDSQAAPIVLDPTTTLSTFDAGGSLDAFINGGLTLGGLEVTGPGSVHVVGADGSVGGTSSRLQLFHSTGLGTAVPVGAPAPIALNTRGFDLTPNPADGNLYVAGTLRNPLPVPGLYGFDPAGVAPVSSFATTTLGWATSGITFDAAGASALVTTDGAGAGSVPNGLYAVPAGGPQVPLVTLGPLPAGIPSGTDDHVITLDGRTIVVGDGSHDLWDATGGAGSVSLLVDLDPLLLPLGARLGVGGVRAAVEPGTGDIFIAWGLSVGADIVRVKDDGSAASVFARGMDGERIRDLDFGPASDGSGRHSLYVSAAMANGGGTIYEITLVPEPAGSALVLIAAALVSCGRGIRVGR